MKIGIDCRLWDETGVGRYIHNLVEQLMSISSTNEYVLFCLDKDWEKIQNSKFKIQNYKIVKANIRWHSLEEQILFPELIVKQGIDLMHFTYFSVPLLYNKPFIVTIHDLIVDHFPTGKASRLPVPLYYAKRLVYKQIMLHATQKSKAIIVPLQAVKKDVEEMYRIDPRKIFVTREGTTKNQESRIKNQEVEKKLKETKYFLHVGNVYPHKNCERLVEAFALLLKNYNDFQLVFVGKEDYFMKHLQQYVHDKVLTDKIIFTGKVSDEELASYYHHAQALIIPSLMEGFGLPAIEAMQWSCLVLASDIPSLREVCKDAAVYFDPYSVEAIAKCMQKAIQLPAKEAQQLQKKGEMICQQFSWEKMGKETLHIYESCSGV